MFQESTTPLMRPNQVEAAKEEIGRLEGMMNAPPHVAAQIQDIGELRRQLKAEKGSLDKQAPKPYGETDMDSAVAREAELRGEWTQGMPTQAEMRRNPAGARDKHMKWERANKTKILEWKNIKLRLHASGYGNEIEGATDLANVEMHRPVEASHELNMHNEQIAGKIQFGPTPGAGPAVVFGTAEATLLETIAPDLSQKLALMSNEQRALVKQFIHKLGESPRGTADSDVNVFSPKPKRKTDSWTPERRAEFGAKMAAIREAKKQEG